MSQPDMKGQGLAKKIFWAPCEGTLAKNLYTKSERMTSVAM